MKHIAIILLSGLAIAAGQQPPISLWEEDFDHDGDYDWIYEVWHFVSLDDDYIWTYYAEDPDGNRVDLPNPWIQWHADIDGDGDLDPVWRNFRDEGRYWFSADESYDAVIDIESDNDGDDLTLFEEGQLGTLHYNPDTDSDTLPDGFEVEHGMDPLTPDPGYREALLELAFWGEQPSITIGRDRTITVTGLYPSEGLTIAVQVSEDLQTWRDGATAEDAVSGVVRFQSPLPAGFVRVAVREE